MKRKSFLGLFIIGFFLNVLPLLGQNYSGTVVNASTLLPVEYVNIGVVHKNIGTVSDINGKYNLIIDQQYDNDTLLFSCIGYESYAIKVADLKNQNNTTVSLKEKVYELSEVTVTPKIFKERTLGITTKKKLAAAGFSDNKIGYELGVLMNVKKTARLKRAVFHFATCSYDTIFYRLNIYKVAGKMNFENILQEPIYVQMPKEATTSEVSIDLQPYNIITDGDFLVTLEHVKDLGPGSIYFCAKLLSKTYFRKTSQGSWETSPIGVSISVVADVEK